MPRIYISNFNAKCPVLTTGLWIIFEYIVNVLFSSLNVLVDDMQCQKESSRRLNDRLGLLEKSLTSCRLLLEEMKHMMEAKGK